MNTSVFKLLIAMATLPAVFSCSKDKGGDTGSGEGQPMERPVELVTDSYTAYPSGANACVDSYLTLTFRTTPSLGTSGQILVKDAAGNVTDMIDMADVEALLQGKPQMNASTAFTTAMDAIGSSALGYYRIVYYNPVSVSGNTVTVRLHSDKLSFGQEYSVEIPEGAILADGFKGIGPGEWSFKVMPQPAKDQEVTVGSRDCDFMTVQGAVNFANSCGQSHDLTISVSEGVYEEQLFIRSKNNLTIRGEGRYNTIISFDNCNAYTDDVGSGTDKVPEPGEPVGKVGGRSVVLVELCDMLRFEDIALVNTHGDGSQAETIYFNSSDGRLVAEGCNFTSEQDTMELKGWCAFRDCSVTGDVDFIWGYVKAALFDSCSIHSCDGGYIVQARCSAGDRGFVFLDCNLTAESEVGDGTVYLARSGGDRTASDNVTYVNCRMGSHISDAGRLSSPAPAPSQATATDGWKEYGSTNRSGVALDLSSRYSGSTVLTDEAYSTYYKDAAAVFSACPHGYSWAE